MVLLDEFLVEGAELAARSQLPLLSPVPRTFIEHIDHRPLGIGDVDVIDAKLQHLGTRQAKPEHEPDRGMSAWAVFGGRREEARLLIREERVRRLERDVLRVEGGTRV